MKKIIMLIAVLFLSYSTTVFSSVTMLKTRIVYSSDSRFEVLKFMNNDDIPYIMQIWADKNNPNSTPDNADAPFMIQPPVFRIDPKTGRDARLIYTGEGLPQDKESIFYLNVAQIPPKDLNQDIKEGNSFTVIVHHRLKIFYRPTSIESQFSHIEKHISFSKGANNNITVKNDSPFFVSFSSLEATNSTGKKFVYKSTMVSPLSTEVLSPETSDKLSFSPDKINYKYLNDLGGQNIATYLIH
ncbi:molecular chaperone [Proteus sp. FME41]|uniref:fimbrial biogenesis chaperone n=1 Tax=Proteus sp. FME41 TaxID=2742608 RepID=UPI0018693886|nr:molecular chaperone [Proteus sp. FME41]